MATISQQLNWVAIHWIRPEVRFAKSAQLLNTYSPTIAFPKDRRESFLDAIESLINDEFDGSTDRHFAMTLAIAKKKDSAE